MIKVVLFGDERVILEWLRMVLSSQADIKIEGEAMTAREMLELVQSSQPDVLVMSIPADASFFDVVRELQTRHTSPKILVLVASADAGQVQEMLKAGVLGCCLRCDDPSHVVTAIRAVAGGLPCESPMARQRLLEHPAPMPNPSVTEQFTQREQEVLKLLAQGLTRKEIAITLCIQDSTLRDRLTSIGKKTGLVSREQLIAYAVRRRFDLL